MADAQPIDLTNTSDEDDPPPKRQREDDPPPTRQPDEDHPPPKRQRGGAGSSSAPGAWHPAVRAQVAGAQLELPDGSSIFRTGVSAKALICLDRLAVLYGSLRAAYDKGYRYYRTPVEPPFHRNEFTLPGSSQRMSAGPFVRHIKELEARARGEEPRGPAMPYFDDDRELVAAARERHSRFFAPRVDEALEAALRASAADAPPADEALEAALRASAAEAEDLDLQEALRNSLRD